jgi:adenosylhomocysteinase
MTTFDAELRWIREHMTVTAAVARALPDLSHVRLACSMHLEVKMAPAIEALVEKGAQVFLTTCNVATVDDTTVAWCRARGADGDAHKHMTPEEHLRSIDRACEFQPTHLCEMGAAITDRLVGHASRSGVQAGLEATGSGTNALAGIDVAYPVFNWDDLPIKEGLHNRRMVGLVACHAFFERTRLTFHNKTVLVVGYGLVGRSACDAARAYGGRVLVAERDAGRALEARFAGEEVVRLDDAVAHVDVIITATGATSVIAGRHFDSLRSGTFLINVGHHSEEIDVAALRRHPSERVRPYVERFELGERSVYLFAGGSMANLTAGHGDSLNAFDVTLATMLAGIGFIAGDGSDRSKWPAGVHVLPRAAWLPVAEAAMRIP